MTIYFKTGHSKSISYRIADRIAKSLKEGKRGIEFYNDEEGTLEIILNLEEILYIN